jgi:hypothetical protein
MDKKIPIQNRILAFFLSLLFSATLIISIFAFPVELVTFNIQSYKPILENSENLSRYPEVISQVLVSRINKVLEPSPLAKILSNSKGLESSFEKNISPESSLLIFHELSAQTLDYLNFKTPNLSLNLDIGELKSDLILKSEAIASEYLSTLPRCSAAVEEESKMIDFDQLPPCKPSSTLYKSFLYPTAIYIDDLINRLPEKASLIGALPFDKTVVDRYFYFYSIGRWALRLLPILAIGLLLIIVLLLQAEKKIMLRWTGRLLLFTSGLGLVGLVILLIGFDQFVVLLLNQYLNDFIEGFGTLLLGFAQEIGYQTLIWAGISFAVVFAFGTFLLIINWFLKPGTESTNTSLNDPDRPMQEGSSSEPLLNGDQFQKEIMPETLEEVEAEEKKNSKKKNTNRKSL